MSVTSLVVFVGGIAGTRLAPVEKLATLPVAMMIIGTASSVVPITMLMKRLRRKKSFILLLVYSILVAFLAAHALKIESFYWFCFSTFLFGATNACVMQFRFAAMESVSTDLMPAAASTVLLGGIVAAFVGPETALMGRNLLDSEFSGSFILMSGLFLIGLLILLKFENPVFAVAEVKSQPRSLREISKQSVFWIAVTAAATGYAVMSFIMTATPVSMHVMDHHSLQNTKWVIQSHIVAMYLPSLIASWIIARVGITRMMIVGLIAYALCIGIAFSGHELVNYWVSLVLLGVGWNFLFIGGTALLPTSYRPEERFRVQGLNEFVVFGTQALAALSAGWFVFTLGWETMLLCTIPILIIQLVLIIRWMMQPRLMH